MKLAMWYFDQCDPKKCSGMQLKRRGLLETIPLKARFSGIVLTPATKTYISRADADLLQEFGVAVIDCSWAFFETVSVKSIKNRERILPNLLASNPVNYGKEMKLSCAEALAAAYYLCGFQEEAATILSQFKWGPAFLTINEYRLENYLEAKSSDEMVQIEQRVVQELEQAREDNRQREVEMPSDSDESDDAAYL